jgi:hypothetical protein
MSAASPAERHAGRLLRCYPRAWRERYGEEFAALLMEEWSERPRCARRTVDVVASGLVARLSGAGMTGGSLDSAAQARASLAALVCTLAAFLALGVSMWAQLTIGWQWSAPDTTGTSIAVVIMTGAVIVFAALAAVAAAPVVWTVLRALGRRQAQSLGRPILLIAVGLGVVVVGSRHFGNGWPGTGGHPWAHQGLVPGGVAAFSWASTLSVTSYWVHPDALSRFPLTEVAWMLASPIAMVTVAVGCAKTIRRAHLSARVLRTEMVLGQLAVGAMLLFVIAAGLWMLNGVSGSRGLFAIGAIDRFALIAMVACLVVAIQSLSRARRVPLSGLTT